MSLIGAGNGVPERTREAADATAKRPWWKWALSG
jgi:hypothetical protein